MEEVDDVVLDETLPNGADPHKASVNGGDHLDIEAYAALYSGRTKIMRLLFIAEKCGGGGNESMRLEALRMAYGEIKKGENTLLFREVVDKIGGRLGPDYGPDEDWAGVVDRKAEARKERLENELNAYRVYHFCFVLFFKDFK